MITAATFRLDQRLARVTGPSSGIGLVLARGLGQASAAGRFVNGHILYVDGGVTATL